MSPVVLRRAYVADAELLSRLWSDTFVQAYNELHSAENIAAYCAANFSLEQARDTLSDPRVVCVFGERDGEATGFSIVKNHASPIALDAPSAELKQLYVLAREYGSGAARRLLYQACSTLRGFGARYAWLAVADENVRARAFYRKLGFELLGVGPTFDVGADPVTSKIMTLRV